jgi:hypothetical protein
VASVQDASWRSNGGRGNTFSLGTRALAPQFQSCSHTASAADCRIYELTIGNQVAGMRKIDCDSDQMAIEKTKKMLDDRDLEVRHGSRVVARLRLTDNK